MKLNHEWFTRTLMHLGRSGDAFPSKTNIIFCVFSGSDVGSKWWLLCSLLHPTKEHLNRLGDILVYTCPGIETMADFVQLTQGGSKVKTLVSINNRGRGLGPCDITRTRIWERLDSKKGISLIWIFKNHWVDLYHYRVVVYTHFSSNNM